MKKYLLPIFIFMALISMSFIPRNNNEIVVVIDASHGGTDFGAKHAAFAEKAIAASIAKKIYDLNSDSEIIVRFTRIADENLTLSERVKIINEINPDLAISIHINSSKSTINSGYQIFIPNKPTTSEKSKAFAERLINSFEKTYPLKNLGLKSAPYMFLKNSNVPTIMIELGYLSNEFDRNYITQNENQNEIAKMILDFIGSLKS